MADEMPQWERELIERQKQETALYRERAQLVAFLAASYPSTIGPAPDAEDWSIVYIRTPFGQMSWHITYADLDLFGHVRIGDEQWDGHTTGQKYERLAELTRTLAEIGTMPQRYVLGADLDPEKPHVLRVIDVPDTGAAESAL